MTIEIAILISGCSLAFAIYQGITNIKRNQRVDDRSEASQLTTVIVKLENIGVGISEIKSDMNNIKKDSKEDHERIIKIESRLDNCEKHCKLFMADNAE